ncbi:MAG: AAA family ATPase [Bacilli bacterium]|nr:AAA family ATPase [Bacilli bacterium]
MIDRTIKESVIKAMNNKPVVHITGARQVGKSTLCDEIKKEFGYEYVSLDNLRERETAIKNPELFLFCINHL